jgi:hypothetical protein
MQAINFEQNCAPHLGRAQGKSGTQASAETPSNNIKVI